METTFFALLEQSVRNIKISNNATAKKYARFLNASHPTQSYWASFFTFVVAQILFVRFVKANQTESYNTCEFMTHITLK